ncbi:MAG: ABC transporter permease [Oscillospiraceae bacterium]|nr:ABC transporter permease [Oscillospiraceae bacterium]
MTIFKYSLKRGLNPLSLLVNGFVPIALMFIPVFWEGNRPGGFGFLSFAMMSGAFIISMTLLTDKVDGAIVRILSAPVTMRQYLVENLMAFMVPLTVQVGIVTILGVILHDWNFTLAIAVFLCYTMLNLSTVAMAFAWHCLFKSKEGSAGAFGMVLTAASMLSGVMMPVEFLPGIIQYIGAVFPMFWMARGLNAVLDYGVMNMTFVIGIAAMVLFSIAFLLYGGKRRIV